MRALTPEQLRSWAMEPAGSGYFPIHPDTLRLLADRLDLAEEAAKDAVVAWSVCASLHRTYAKTTDAFFTTRQRDLTEHVATAKKRFDRITKDEG